MNSTNYKITQACIKPFRVFNKPFIAFYVVHLLPVSIDFNLSVFITKCELFFVSVAPIAGKTTTLQYKVAMFQNKHNNYGMSGLTIFTMHVLITWQMVV